MFKQTARLWSHVYAGAPVSSPEYTRKIDKLCAMGFEKVSVSQLFKKNFLLQNQTKWLLNGLFFLSSQNAVIVALSSKSWDVETATELLLSNWILTPSSSWSPSLLFTHSHPPSSKPSLSPGVFSPVAPSVSQWSSHLRAYLLLHPTLHPLCGLSSLLITSAVPHSNQSLCELFLWFYVHSTFHSVLQSKVQPHCTPFEANVRFKNPPAPPVSQHSWLCPRGSCQRLILAYAVHLLLFVKTFCRRESSHFKRLFWAWSWFFTHFWAGLLNRDWATS